MKITTVITVFNGAGFIQSAVESILNQSHDDIELLVVNDGSTDDTASVLEGILDTRLRIIDLPRTGRAGSLFLACNEAKGKYIAILDADDVSFADRIKKQIEFLETHPEYVWLGSGEEQEDSRRNEHLRRIYPLSDEAIRRQSAKCIPYCHSAVMFRKSLIDEGINYDPKQPYLIDFEFFLRVAERYKVANISDVLVKRYVRNESYFQTQFKTSRQNFRLTTLCSHAVKLFSLPKYYYVYPITRLLYPYIPGVLKKVVRRNQGLRETDA